MRRIHAAQREKYYKNNNFIKNQLTQFFEYCKIIINWRNKIMEELLLTNPNIFPENDVLENILGKQYKYYQKFVEKLNENKLTIEWNYYEDGKSWLCKIIKKMKTVCWLSIKNNGINLSFYFTEKNINGVKELEIDEKIKGIVDKTENVGKLLPIIFVIDNKNKINDAMKIMEYKIKIK